MSALAFAAGGALVAVAGTLVSTFLTFNPAIGVEFTMKALVVVMMGGVGNMVGSLVAGVLLGVAEVALLLPSRFRPDAGGRLFPVPDRPAGSAARTVRNAVMRALRSPSSRSPCWSPALAAVPWLVSDYGLGFMVNLMCYLVLTVAWALFSGTTRYVSLATAAFFGLGAYTVAMLVKVMPIYATFGIALVARDADGAAGRAGDAAHFRHVLRHLRVRPVRADARAAGVVGDQPDPHHGPLRLRAVRHDADLRASARAGGAGVPGRAGCCGDRGSASRCW